jgi:hypothetical protein
MMLPNTSPELKFTTKNGRTTPLAKERAVDPEA